MMKKMGKSVLRFIVLKAVTVADMKAIGRKLVALSKQGDLQAVRELLDRVLGRPLPSDVEERIAALEDALTEEDEQR